MNPLVVVQARSKSRRLPRKVLRPLAGEPMLLRQLERIQAAHTPINVVVATTTDPSDDVIVMLAHHAGVDVVRGHPTDLLARHLTAAKRANADVVVKIPSDCPLIDPDAIDCVIGAFQASAGRVDYASNLHPPSWPDGNDVEVFTTEALQRAEASALKSYEREHTTPYFWENPDRFAILNVRWPDGRDLSRTHRFTVDYEADLRFVCAVFDALYSPNQRPFRLDQILDFLDANPRVMRLNSAFTGVNWYRHHLDELRTVSAKDTRIPGNER